MAWLVFFVCFLCLCLPELIFVVLFVHVMTIACIVDFCQWVFRVLKKRIDGE